MIYIYITVSAIVEGNGKKKKRIGSNIMHLCTCISNRYNTTVRRMRKYVQHMSNCVIDYLIISRRNLCILFIYGNERGRVKNPLHT